VKIAFDAFEAGFHPRTGTSHYVAQLTEALLRVDSQNTYELFYKSGHTILNSPDSISAKPNPLWSPSNRTFWSQIRLPISLMRHSFDIIHSPGHRVPWGHNKKLICTIHDLAVLRFPEMFTPGHRTRLAWFTKSAVDRSNRIIADSEATKRDLCEFYKINPEKIDVVHLGVNSSLFHPHKISPRDQTPYILAVGALQPRKNYSLLIRAFERLCEIWQEPLELRIAGQRGWMWQPLEEQVKNSPVAKRIHLLGYVPETELPTLYATATMFAMPSLYEGFGIPLLEAMASGTPILAANNSSLPEVVGDSALLLDANDVNVWTHSMLKLLKDPKLCDEMTTKGLARARKFSWEETARKTISVYERFSK
jgi:glycosyltransferase involved in cell wall biosynthesis